MSRLASDPSAFGAVNEGSSLKISSPHSLPQITTVPASPPASVAESTEDISTPTSATIEVSTTLINQIHQNQPPSPDSTESVASSVNGGDHHYTNNIHHQNYHHQSDEDVVRFVPKCAAPVHTPSFCHHGDLRPTAFPSRTGLATNLFGPSLMSDNTPATTAPSSPRFAAIRPTSTAASTPRFRPTTLDIPGLTRSKVSPDGKIAQRDVGSKLVIIMVGLPARGKSYITKKLARYLNWLQHDTKIFNVGERRRLAAGGPIANSAHPPDHGTPINLETAQQVTATARSGMNLLRAATEQLAQSQGHSHDDMSSMNIPTLNLPNAVLGTSHLNGIAAAPVDDLSMPNEAPEENIDQSAGFFDPTNRRAARIREQAAMETLDELLDYILNQNGSVAIFDATNSTLERRKAVMTRIRECAGPAINVLFVESVCKDESLLEANMRLKLSGPDYKDTDPVQALEDFRQRVAIYEKNYVPLGDYEEDNNMPYVKMVDVGRKVICHQVQGFLSTQAVYYLLNFNLSPRAIWITRHAESEDNIEGRIGGDSNLSPAGQRYSKALTAFIDKERESWEQKQREKAANTHFPPHPGDHTPPNPHFSTNHALQQNGGIDPEDWLFPTRNFCVWTSMLKRSIETAQYFDDEERWDLKQFRMLDELNAGIMEGMTYKCIREKYSEEYKVRSRDKMAYRYPGPGGESYLDVINRLRPVIVELERMEDHCLIITHRSVCRVLLAYFLGLRRDSVADLDCPLGLVWRLEPKPYGVEFKAFRYDEAKDDFFYDEDYSLKKSSLPVD